MQYVLAIGCLAGLAALIWYFFMLPLGRERHERELELIRRKLQRREAERQDSEQSKCTDRAS